MFDKLFKNLSAFEWARSSLLLPTPVHYAPLVGHSGSILALALGADARLYSGSGDKTIKVWDVSSGACVRTLKGHSHWVQALALKSDGQLYSGSRDKTIKVWDVSSGACVRTLTGHSYSVEALALGTDGRLYSGSRDKTIKVWDVSSGACVRTLKEHSGWIKALALEPGERLYSGSSDTTIKVWDVSSGVCVRTLKGHSDLVHALALDTDGRLYSGSYDNTIKVWDVSSGACVRTLKGHSYVIFVLALGSDGRLYSGGGDNMIKVWDVSSGACAHTLKGHSDYVQALALGADGRLYSGSGNGTIKVRDEGIRLQPALSGVSSSLKAIKGSLKSEQLQGGSFSGLPQAQLQHVKRFESVLGTALAVLACESVSGFERTSSLVEARQNVLQVLDGVAKAVPAFRRVLGEIEKQKSAPKLVSLKPLKKEEDDKPKSGLFNFLWENKQNKSSIQTKDATPMRFNLSGDVSFKPQSKSITLKGAPKPTLKPAFPVTTKKLLSTPIKILPLPKPALYSMRCTSDWKNEKVGYLVLEKEAVLEVLVENENGWYVCRLKGKEGLAPKTLLKSVNQEVKADYAQIPSNQLALKNQVLGEGVFGKVQLAEWKPHRMKVAVKILHARELSEEAIQELKNEAGVMAKLRASPFVVQLFGLTVNPHGLVMECCEISLHKLLHDKAKALSWSQRQRFAIDIASGLMALHHEKVLHRDLKSHNVLITEHGRAKLCDFGLARVRTEAAQAYYGQAAGTVSFMAPELFKRRAKHTFFSDVYSLGMIFWEIASRAYPFADAQGNNALITKWISEGDYDDIPAQTPPTLKRLIEQAWNAVPGQRGTAEAMVDALEKSFNEAVTLDRTLKPRKAWEFYEPQNYEPPKAKAYRLWPAAQQDVKRLFDWWRQHPMKGKTIHSITLIDHPKRTQKFEATVQELQGRARREVFQPAWKRGSPHAPQYQRRQRIEEDLTQRAQPHQDAQHPDVKLLPCWHGTKPEIVESICEVGFANLASTDPGYFGKGIYNACESDYAARAYGKGMLVLLNWVACYSAFPLLHEDWVQHFVDPNTHAIKPEKGNHKNFDAHYVPVKPATNHPNEVEFYPLQANEAPKYTEVVVFNAAQCKPTFIVELKDERAGLPRLPDKTAEEKDVYGKMFKLQIKGVTALPPVAQPPQLHHNLPFIVGQEIQTTKRHS